MIINGVLVTNDDVIWIECRILIEICLTFFNPEVFEGSLYWPMGMPKTRDSSEFRGPACHTVGYIPIHIDIDISDPHILSQVISHSVIVPWKAKPYLSQYSR